MSFILLKKFFPISIYYRHLSIYIAHVFLQIDHNIHYTKYNFLAHSSFKCIYESSKSRTLKKARVGRFHFTRQFIFQNLWLLDTQERMNEWMSAKCQRRIRQKVCIMAKCLTTWTTIPIKSKIVWHLLLPQTGNSKYF